MQEEVTQKTIAFSIKSAKLTIQVLQAAARKFLETQNKGKTKLHHGQQSLKQLKKHGAALSNIEITEANIGAFKPCAKKYGVELEVLSSLNPVPGTIVKEVADDMEGMLIKGVAKDTDVAVISIMEVPDVPGMSFKVFGALASRNINVDIILQSTGRGGNKDLIFTVPLGEAENAVEVLKENQPRFGGKEIKVEKNYAKVSVVGAGMQSNPGVASRMFEALFEANVNIHMISTSEIKISVIIDEKEADRAVSAIHGVFIP